MILRADLFLLLRHRGSYFCNMKCTFFTIQAWSYVTVQSAYTMIRCFPMAYGSNCVCSQIVQFYVFWFVVSVFGFCRAFGRVPMREFSVRLVGRLIASGATTISDHRMCSVGRFALESFSYRSNSAVPVDVFSKMGKAILYRAPITQWVTYTDTKTNMLVAVSPVSLAPGKPRNS